MRKSLLLGLFILIFALPVQAADKPLLDIKEITSPGGLTAWLVEDHSVPVIAASFGFRGAGTVLDPQDKQGLVRMLSNTLDEGAGPLDAQTFQKELHDLVIDLRYSAGRDHFNGTLKTLTKNKARAFELLQLSLNQPRFEAEAVERMRQANQSRIRSSLSDPEWMAARLLNDKAFAGHPYAMNSGGTLSSLESITPADLKALHKQAIGKNNLVVAVAGDITAEELAPLLDQVFGALPEVTLPEIANIELQNQGQTFLYKQDIPQTIIEIVQPGIPRKDPQYHLAQVMNFILGSSGFGSRLMEEIREKRGLAYGVYSGLDSMDRVQTLSITTSTENKNAVEVLKLIPAELTRLSTEPVSETELADAKSYLIGSLPLSLTSTDKIAGLVNSLQLDGLPVDYLDARETAIENATVADIQTVAQRLLKPASFVTVLVGKPEGIENATAVDALPNVE